MRIYTSITWDMSTLEEICSEGYEYNGPIAECKGGGSTKTEYVQSPEAAALYEAALPGIQRMSQAASSGQPLWNAGNISTSSLGYYPTSFSPYEVPSSSMLMPSAANLGNIAPEIRTAVWEPYQEAAGNLIEQYGGGYGSARGGVSGAGAGVLSDFYKEAAPQYASSLWGMVSPGLSAEYQGLLGANQTAFTSNVASQLARAQAATGLTGQEYAARQAAYAAPYAGLGGIATGNIPTAVQQPQGGKK